MFPKVFPTDMKAALGVVAEGRFREGRTHPESTAMRNSEVGSFGANVRGDAALLTV